MRDSCVKPSDARCVILHDIYKMRIVSVTFETSSNKKVLQNSSGVVVTHWPPMR